MKESPILRIIAAIVLVVVLILGAWGVIVVATSAPTIFSNIGGAFSSLFVRTPAPSSTPTQPTNVETLAVTLPQGPLPSGSPFTLSWTHTGGQGSYGYKVAYSCGPAKNVTIDAQLPTGAYQGVSCDTPFNYTNATSQMTLVPHVIGALGASAQFTVYAVDLSNGTTTASGTAIASFLPSAAGSSKDGSPKVSKGGTGAGTAYSNPAGIADLSVQITYVSDGSVQFKIQNVGTKTAPAGWIFTAALPLYPGYAYTSVPQRSIAPGGYIINTLGWNPSQSCGYQTYPYQYNQACGHGTITINVDPYGVIIDANRGNNTASVSI